MEDPGFPDPDSAIRSLGGRAKVTAAEEGTLAIIRTHSFAETRFEPAEYFQSGIASTGRGSP